VVYLPHALPEIVDSRIIEAPKARTAQLEPVFKRLLFQVKRSQRGRNNATLQGEIKSRAPH
jgi:hypothetical protein